MCVHMGEWFCSPLAQNNSGEFLSKINSLNLTRKSCPEILHCLLLVLSYTINWFSCAQKLYICGEILASLKAMTKHALSAVELGFCHWQILLPARSVIQKCISGSLRYADSGVRNWLSDSCGDATEKEYAYDFSVACFTLQRVSLDLVL